jgi:hypothetical protein
MILSLRRLIRERGRCYNPDTDSGTDTDSDSDADADADAKYLVYT